MTHRVVVVAFDLMDTLVHDPFREALLAATGLPAEVLFRKRDASAYPAFERGEIDEATYWSTFVAAGIPVDPDRFHEVRRARTRWLPGMRSLALQVRAAGCRVVVASNYPHWLAEHRDGLLTGVADDVIGSHDLGVRKPDEAFYRALVGRVDVRPEEVLFVDDRETNLDGARRVGLRTVLAAPAEALRDTLADHGVPLE